MAYYDEQGFSRMQRDALERMRDMQRRSKSLVFETNPTPDEVHAPPPKCPPQQPPKAEHHRPTIQQSASGDMLSSLLSGIGTVDSERLLILLVLFILYKNKADIKLIIALGYLLL